MSVQLDDHDLKLLDFLQRQLPLVERPFEEVAKNVGMTESQVLERIAALKTKPRGVIRQISAIFDSRTLGYTSCLVAAKVDESKIESAAAEINLHPGVSHNYRRNHTYNLWYTLAVPPNSRLGLQKTVDFLHERSGAIVTRLMPSLKLYKIGVKFNLAGEGDVAARVDAPAFDSEPQSKSSTFVATERDKRMIRALQKDLPIESRPFDRLAEEAGVDVPTLLHTAKEYETLGCMRRFSAVLRHREAGFGANAMGCWIVPANQQDTFGPLAASFSAVSHCYLRPSYEDWPYSIFTMVHGKSPEECHQVLAAISKQSQITQYTALFSSHEYKKVRVKYFMGDIEAWETQALASSQIRETV
ncbi:MAG TPA: AsnC family transcriptional regulator [Tepidisphaeraceae bacterium]|nr:AsnC family transcriptional regulator [Tepidisphaeraceae bacterium]